MVEEPEVATSACQISHHIVPPCLQVLVSLAEPAPPLLVTDDKKEERLAPKTSSLLRQEVVRMEATADVHISLYWPNMDLTSSSEPFNWLRYNKAEEWDFGLIVPHWGDIEESTWQTIK